MPRGDGGWYPIALDCAPFRFPAPSSKTKSHSTFPIENDTCLVSKFRERFFRNLVVIFWFIYLLRFEGVFFHVEI